MMASNITHEFTLPLHVNPEQLDPCLSSKWIAFPVSRTTVGLWKQHSSKKGIASAPIELSGHLRPITALCFKPREPDCLTTACSEQILVWDLGYENSQDIQHELFFSRQGSVSVMCFNNSGRMIAAGVDNSILLLESNSKEPIAVFDMHAASINGLEFCPHFSSTLISISDDRSFCVWDTNDMVLIYRSTIIAAGPLISLSMNLIIPQIAVGSADGKLMLFDLTDGNDFRHLTSVDVSKSLRKHLSKQEQDPTSTGPVHVSKKGRSQTAKTYQNVNDIVHSVESSESVLSIQYAYFSRSYSPSQQMFESTPSGASEIVNDSPPSICVVSSNSILQVNSNTFEVQNMIDLQRPMESNKFGSSHTIGAVAYGNLQQTGPGNISVIVGSLFDRKISALQWFFTSPDVTGLSNVQSSDFSTDEELNIIAETQLLPSSPLKSEILPPIVSKVPTKGDIATGKAKSKSSMNQPLTFKSNVKSSGYSQAPRTTMFKPETRKNKLLNIGDRSKPVASKTVTGKLVKKEYDTESGPPVNLCDNFNVDVHSPAVLNLRFSNDGTGLACALSNKNALVMKSPYSKHKSVSYTGHNNVVNTAHISNDGETLLTASNDKTIRLWDKSGGDPILVLAHHNGTKKEQQNKGHSSSVSSTPGSQTHEDSAFGDSNSTGGQSYKPFAKEIKCAQFFYMDKFILSICGNELLLYKYYVSNERDEIKRYQSRNSCRLIQSWQTKSTSFNSFTAVNTFFSHLVICTTSGRNLEIYDLNRSQLAYTFEDCHSRPPYCVCINEGSRFSSQPPEAHNVIASVAQTDPIKIWDVRSKRSVQSLHGHGNGAHMCQIAFSPCGNYIASGSEDKTVYLYDMRKGTFCERIRGHTEVVTSVAFHPAQPLLVSGSLNGKLLFFKS